MASGCTPVAAYGNGSDEIIEDGVNGLQYRDPNVLADNIVKAADTRFGSRARATIVEHFNAENGADRCAELYDRLAF